MFTAEASLPLRPTPTAPTGASKDATEGHPAASPAASPASDTERAGLWRLALQRLSQKDRDLIHRMSQEQSIQDSDDPSRHPLLLHVDGLIDLAKKRQDECDKKAWKVLVAGGHEIILRDLAAKVVGWLNTFKEVGDTVVQYDPVHAALPWAAVRFFIQAAVNERDQMHSLLIVVETVTRITSRCRVYEAIYSPQGFPFELAKDLQTSLVNVYEAVLTAIAIAFGLFRKGTAKRALHAVFKPEKMKDAIREVELHERNLRHVAVACEATRLERLSSASVELRGLLKKMEGPVTRIDSQVEKQMEAMNQRERLALLGWISPVLFGSHHAMVSESRTPDTCGWLLNDPRFFDWQDTSSSAYLLLYGIPGSGKTYLTSRVVDWAQEALSSSPSDEALAYFYCKRDENERNESLQVLRSYLRQLATAAGKRYADGRLINHEVQRLRNDCIENGKTLTIEMCKSHIVALANLYPRTTIILDALDECNRDTRQTLLDFFDQLAGDSLRPVKIFISSRMDADIQEHFDSRPSIQIKASDNGHDVAKFMNKEIVRHRRWARMSPSLREHIKSVILERSDGMFQWAALQIKQLLELRSEQAIKDRLGKLPKTLEQAYDEIYSNIDNLHPHEKMLVTRALKWVLCAYTPLTTPELLEAIHLDPDRNKFPRRLSIDQYDLLELCQNLLVLQTNPEQYPRHTTWHFSHLSVTEYLEKKHFTLIEAHYNAACVSLIVLNHTHGTKQTRCSKRSSCQETTRRPELQLQDFRSYTTDFWWTHIPPLEIQRDKCAHPRVSHLLGRFLGRPYHGSKQYLEWCSSLKSRGFFDAIQTHWEGNLFFSGTILSLNAYSIFSDQPPPVFLAAILAIYHLLPGWWADSDLLADVQVSDLAHQLTTNALCPVISLVAVHDDTHLLEHLLGMGVDESEFRMVNFHPLCVAAASRSSAALRVFLQHKFKPNGSVPRFWSRPLAAAAKYGSTDAVRQLLDAGANPNLGYIGEDMSSVKIALYPAVALGQLDKVQLLVEKGGLTDLIFDQVLPIPTTREVTEYLWDAWRRTLPGSLPGG